MNASLLLVGFLSVSFSASAQEVAPPPPLALTTGTPATYDCNLIVVDSRLPDGVQSQTFQASGPATGSHGGDPYKFTIGLNQFAVTADARWRGIEWTRQGVPIANSVEVSDSDRLGSQVTMVYNPTNTDESAAVECHPTPPPVP